MENNGIFYRQEMKRIDDHYGQKKEKTVEEIKHEISLTLKAYRAEYRLTQEQLAKKLGFTRMQVIRWEDRKSKPSNAAMKLLRLEGVFQGKENR